MFLVKLLPLCILVSSLAGVTGCATSQPEPAAAEIYNQLKAIQQESDRGNLRQSLHSIALLKDSVNKLSANEVLKQRVALTQADIQNMYTLCFATAFDTAKQYATQLIGNATQMPDSLKAATFTTVGFQLYLAALINKEATMDSAFALFRSSNQLYTKGGDLAGMALTCFYMGLCYENNSDSTKVNGVAAEDHYQKALALATQAENLRVKSYACRHLAGITFDRHQIDSAIRYASESYALREQSGWQVYRPFTISLLGDIYRAKNLDSAKKFHTLALQYAQELGYPGAIANNKKALAVDDSLSKAKNP